MACEQGKLFLVVQLNQNTNTGNFFKSGSKINVICEGDTMLLRLLG